MLEGVEFVKLKGEELEPGGVEESEALEGGGVALGGDVGSWRALGWRLLEDG